MPSSPVQQPSETPPECCSPISRPRSRASERARSTSHGGSRHRRPGAAVLDLAGDAVVGPVALELGEREHEILGHARADVDRGPRLARDGVHGVAAAHRRDHRRHLGPAGGERLDAQDLARQGRDGASAAVGVGSGVRRAAVQLERPPDRALALRHQVAVLAGALEDERGRGSRRLGAHGRRAKPGLLVGAHQQAHLRERPARRRGEPLHRGRRQEHAALHVGHAGPEAAVALAPKRPPRGGARRGRRCRCGPGARPSGRRRPAASRPCCAPARRARAPTGSCSRPAPATRPPARRSTPAPSRRTASRGSRAARAWRRSARRPQKP